MCCCSKDWDQEEQELSLLQVYGGTAESTGQYFSSMESREMLDVFRSSECSERPRAVFRPQEKWPTLAATSVATCITFSPCIWAVPHAYLNHKGMANVMYSQAKEFDRVQQDSVSETHLQNMWELPHVMFAGDTFMSSELTCIPSTFYQ